MKSVITIFLGLLSFSVFGTTCSDVNLLTEKDSPFKYLPVYDQDGLGICYAYAAAQMVDYHLIKNGAKKRQMSPLWLAMTYSLTKNRDDLTAGTVDDAINSLQKYRNCDYDLVSKALSEYMKTAGIPEVEVLALFEKSRNELRKITLNKLLNPSFGKPNSSLSFLTPKTEVLLPLKVESDFEKAFKAAVKLHGPGSCSTNSQLEKLLPLFEPLLKLDTVEATKGLLTKYCKGDQQKILSLPKSKKIGFKGTDKEIMTTLASLLKNNKSPVGISYCSEVLAKPTASGLLINKEGKRLFKKKGCGGHGSIVVGSKTVNKSCKMLIRNTWGSNFWSNTNLKCFCRHKKNGTFVDDCTKQTHNNGQYIVEGCWVDADSLVRNTSSLTTLN